MWMMTLISQRITAPTKAGTNPSIVKPATNWATKSSRSAFITKVNKPRVRMFMGSVSIRIIGLMSVLIIPRIMATMRAVINELT